MNFEVTREYQSYFMEKLSTKFSSEISNEKKGKHEVLDSSYSLQCSKGNPELT